MSKTKTETSVDFSDLSYEKRRQILRQAYLQDKCCHKAIKTLAYKVKKHLENPRIPELFELQTIIKFIIDGFLAYEIIRDKYGRQIAVIELDPITLTAELIEKNNGDYHQIWIQYKGDIKKEISISDGSVLYFSYCKGNATMNVSFLESVYTGAIDPNDKKFIKKHYKEIIAILSK